MKHKIAIILVSAALLGALTGCQLAVPGLSVTSDRLVGIFATTTSLDLGPAGRIDATAQTQTDQDPDGSTQSQTVYDFPGLDGFYLMNTFNDDTGNSTYTTGSDSMTDIAAFISMTNDDQTGFTLKGTLHVSLGTYEFHMYAIRQAADGSVYLMGSGDQSIFVGGGAIGTTYSQTFSESNTITTGGQSVTTSSSVEFKVRIEATPVDIVIIEMDSDNVQLHSTQYSPGDVPETLTPDADTAYLIVETHTVDGSGNLGAQRAVYSRGDSNLYSFAARPDGICVQHITDIAWPK